MIEKAFHWILFSSIYGPAICAFGIGLLCVPLQRISARLFNPFAWGAATLVLGLLSFPSIPRYQFERDILAQIAQSPWTRIVNQTKWGDLTEPLTWIWTPTGSFFLIAPNEIKIGGFREISLRYEEEPHIWLATPDCETKTIERAEPDDQGTFRITTPSGTAMTEDDYDTYCKYDWKTQKDSLRSAILNTNSAK